MSLAASHPSRITVAALVLLLVSQFAAIAAPPDPDRAAAMQREADATLKGAVDYEARAAKAAGEAAGELADAFTNAASANRQVADALKTCATAVGAGNDEDMKSAQAAFFAAQKQQRLANEQLGTRERVFNFQPNDAAIESLTKSTPEANKPLLDAQLAAINKAVDSAATFYAVLTPEANSDDIEVARDLWTQSINELDLAKMALEFANDRAWMGARKRKADIAAAAQPAETMTTDDEKLANRKAAQAIGLQFRALDRKRKAAFREVEALLRNSPQP